MRGMLVGDNSLSLIPWVRGGGKGGGVWPMLIKIVWLGERELRHTNTLNLHGIGKELMATIHDP